MLKPIPLIMECLYIPLTDKQLCPPLLSNYFSSNFIFLTNSNFFQPFGMLLHKPKNVFKGSTLLIESNANSRLGLQSRLYLSFPCQSSLIFHFSPTGSQVVLLTAQPMPCLFLSLVMFSPTQTPGKHCLGATSSRKLFPN